MFGELLQLVQGRVVEVEEGGARGGMGQDTSQTSRGARSEEARGLRKQSGRGSHCGVVDVCDADSN